MGSTNITITAAITALEAEIESHNTEIARLNVAIEALQGLVVGNDEVTVAPTKGTSRKSKATPKVTESPKGGTESDRRKARLAQARAERLASSTDTDEVVADTASAKVTKAKSNGTKPNRREQIISLLAKDMTPKDIGAKLGIAPNYVYHVKRSL